MKNIKALLAVVLSIVLFASLSSVGMIATAEEDGFAPTKIEGARWFPCPQERLYDDVWEVECVKEGCLCQRFQETAEDTGNTNFLDTVYNEDGSLTLTRNGADGEEYYWPRIRTVSLETYPELDIKTSNTLYFDIVVEEGTQWNISLGINGMIISLGRYMAESCGATNLDPNSPDAASGTYKGSVNIQEAINKFASDPSHLDNVNAVALQNMKKTFLPQVQIYVVGGVNSSLTINELYISTPEDTAGEKCHYVDMGLVTGLGEEWYLMNEEEGEETDTNEGVDEDVDNETDKSDADVETDPTEADKKDDKTTPTAVTTTKPVVNDGGDNNLILIIIGAAVAVVAIIGVVVVILKEKKA